MNLHGKNNNNVIFIKWFPYDKRNEAISEAIRADCYFIFYFKKRSIWNASLRYLLQFVKSIFLFITIRPKIIFVTNPPIFAVLCAAIYCSISKANFIIDSHAGAFKGKWAFFSKIHEFVSRKALLAITTNAFHDNIYQKWGVDSYIISDTVTDYPVVNIKQLRGFFNIVFISSFAPDEPFREVLRAASELRTEIPGLFFYVTGNPRNADPGLLKNIPDNLILTGFLPDQDYFDLLHSADAIMVLCAHDNTMQQGAYEAVSVQKPMILSDWSALRSIYTSGTVFVKNNAESIAEGVKKTIHNHQDLKIQMIQLKEKRKIIWDNNCAYLNQLINDIQ